MAGSEFDIIRRHFARRVGAPEWLKLGIGDDAAVIQPPSGRQLVSTLDALISGRHFPENTEAASIGWKALAVNASDLVAMAAEPAFFLLSLSLPEDDEHWLERFADGLFRAANAFGMTLVGGDTCRGPLSISIQANGWVEEGGFVTRAGARIGDRIWLSGRIGDAALALRLLWREIDPQDVDAATTADCFTALNYPQPRLPLIPLIKAHASAAIDISDGLSADLGHLLDQSAAGALIDGQRLPLNDWLRSRAGDRDDALSLALCGGDDYEILFTAPAEATPAIRAAAQALPFALTEIGRITEAGRWLDTGERRVELDHYRGYDHFKG